MFDKEISKGNAPEIEEISEYSSFSDEQDSSAAFSESQSSVEPVEPVEPAPLALKRNFQAFAVSLNDLLKENREKDKKIKEIERENTRLHFAIYDEIDNSDKTEFYSRKQALEIRTLNEKLQALEEKEREYQIDSAESIAKIVILENDAKRLKVVHQEDKTVNANLQKELTKLQKELANSKNTIADQDTTIRVLAGKVSSSSKTSSLEQIDGLAVRALAPSSPNRLLLLSEAANGFEKINISSSLGRRESPNKENGASPIL